MYVCGWDGGGTKTEVCLLGDNGENLGASSFGPLNINGAAEETVRATVRDAVAYMAGQAGGLKECGALVIGMAGASNAQAVSMLEQAVRAQGYPGPLRILGDQEIALAGAVRGHGAVLIAGTGAICFGRDSNGTPFRVGGYGYLIDDGGSGYAIGRDILAAAARAEDGRGAPTCLREQVFQALGVENIGGVITWLYAPGTGKKEVASLAPLLSHALEMEDETARGIAEKAARDLAELVITAWRKTGMRDGELALTGSILNRFPLIRALTKNRILEALPALRVISPHASAAQGAALLAMKALQQQA